jgi:site-specific recombinase XerD
MKTQLPNLLGAVARDYFTDHLPRLRGMSPHTIHSYRDTFVLLLRFLSAHRNRPVAELDLTDLDPPAILAFLSYLERERENGVTTRNVRLAAIHALFRFVASRNPEHLDLAQRVLGIPFKRAPQPVIDYLEYDEIESILKTIDRTTPRGSRNYALLATMFNTGARVQEIADLRACDLQLSKPFQVRLLGKGRRERYCPLWPQTASVLRTFCKERNLDLRSEARLFLNHRREPLTRFGIRYILARCLDRACQGTPNLRKKRLHPHSLRHSMAIALRKSGVDLSTISQYLGHSSPTTTNRYARIDLEMKRQAIARVKPVPRQSRKPWSKDHTLLDWLESLLALRNVELDASTTRKLRAWTYQLHITGDFTLVD